LFEWRFVNTTPRQRHDPIRRGPLKYVFWSRRSIKKLNFPRTDAQPDETYTCPLCGTRLFEKCDACDAIRHALLPSCAHRGKTKSSAEMFQKAAAADQPAT